MTEPTNAERLQAIAAREAKATPGPWEQDRNTVHVGDEYGTDFRYIVPIDDMRPDQPRDEDAEFMANAREDIPWLLAQNTELREQRNATREVARRLISEKDALKSENTELRDALAALTRAVEESGGTTSELGHSFLAGKIAEAYVAARAVFDKWKD